jgi:hypothetical protein
VPQSLQSMVLATLFSITNIWPAHQVASFVQREHQLQLLAMVLRPVLGLGLAKDKTQVPVLLAKPT